MDLKEIGWERVNSINLAQYRNFSLALVKALMKLCVPENSGTFLTS
jgi:hypothetical protein